MAKKTPKGSAEDDVSEKEPQTPEQGTGVTPPDKEDDSEKQPAEPEQGDLETDRQLQPDGKVEEAPMPNQSIPTGGKSPNIVEKIYMGLSEKLYTESPYHPDSLMRPYNPDKLVRKDWAYRIYEDMMEDDQCYIAMEVKKDLILGSGFYFETKDDDQEEVREDLEIAFEEQGERVFSDMLKDMLQAYEYGFSISEKIFACDSKGKLFLKDLKPRHPSTWLLHTDKHGNMTRYEQKAMTESVDANPDSIIHYINNPKHQNPYGRSDLYPAFQAWMTKRHITRFYAIFLEKAASPTPVGKYDRRADQKAIDDMYAAIKQFQTKTALVIPKEFEMEFLESKSSGEAYIKGINLFNMFIGRAMFLPDLLGYQGAETGGGSFSLGEHQISVFLKHIARRREIVQRIVNNHFVKPICMYNYGMMENFPKWKLNPLSDEDAQKQAELWIKAATAKLWTVTPEEVNHLRGIVKFPKSSVVDITEALPVGPDGQNLDPNDPNAEPQFDENGKPIPGGGDDPSGKAGPTDPTAADKGAFGKGKEAGGKGPDEAPAPGKGKAPGDKTEKPPLKKKFEVDLSKMRGDFHKKVDFAHVEDVMKANIARILTEAKPIVADMFEDLYDQIQKKKIIQSQDLDKAGTISLKWKKRLQLVFKKNFRHLYNDGKASGKAEVSLPADHQFAANIPHDEFLDFLDQESFRYIGDYEYTILKRVKDELVKAIKDGRPLSEVISVLDNEGMVLSDVSIERFARTKTTEVFNKGRKAYFDETGVVSAYQYSAILDDRTSDICAGLDGCIFEAEAAPIPPLHFNCRSVLIPITKFENYEPDTEANNGDDMSDFIEENIGKSFPIN